MGETDKKLFDRIRRIIIETARTPFDGIGNPNHSNSNSKVIGLAVTDEHRLVYKVTDEQLIIVSCKYHYE